jgi:hypothetical protein
MKLDFGAILSRAWKITWENKVLWIFGLLAAMGNGAAGGGGGAGGGDGGGGRDFGPGGPELPPPVRRFVESPDPRIIAIVIGVICVLVLIALVLFVLSIIGRGGLIGGVRLADDNGRVTFGEAWRVGLRNFWRVFLIGLIVGVVVIGLVLILLVPGIFFSITIIGLLCGLPLIFAFVVAAIVLGIVAYFAQIAAVVEDLSVTAALGRAWEVIRANLGDIIILGIVLIVAQAVIGVVIALPLIVTLIPIVFAVIGFINESQNMAVGGLIVAGLCFVAYLPVLIVLGGVLETWITSAWTLAYRQVIRPMATPGAQSAPLAPAA